MQKIRRCGIIKIERSPCMLLRIAIVDDLPQDAERLQQALTAE